MTCVLGWWTPRPLGEKVFSLTRSLPHRSPVLPAGEESRAGGPAHHPSGCGRGDGGGDGAVLWRDDWKGTSAPGSWWWDSDQTVGSQQQTGGSGRGRAARHLKLNIRRPKQSWTDGPSAGAHTKPRTTSQCCGVVGLFWPRGEMDWNDLSRDKLIGAVTCMRRWLWSLYSDSLPSLCLYAPASGYSPFYKEIIQLWIYNLLKKRIINSSTKTVHTWVAAVTFSYFNQQY